MGRKARFDVVLDCSDPEKLAGFWGAALGYRAYHSEASHTVLVPRDGTAPLLVLQQVAEPKVGKNRMHVDIVTDDVEPEVDRLEALGARRLHNGIRSLGQARWVTMADPEGHEFCVCTGVEW